MLDAGQDPAEAGRLTAALAGRVDLLFGPYGSGATRAAAEAMAGRREVVWNHGGAAVPGRRARRCPSWARRSATGPAWPRCSAPRASTSAGSPCCTPRRGSGAPWRAARAPRWPPRAPPRSRVAELTEAGAARAAAGALAAGAAAVVGCGRIEDDLALGRALAGAPAAVGLVVCGVALAAEALGRRRRGLVRPGPVVAGRPGCRRSPCRRGADYPAAQALAAGLVAGEALARRRHQPSPTPLWDAARALRTRTFLGPFAVDAEGRQTAQAPVLVRWVRAGGELRARSSRGRRSAGREAEDPVARLLRWFGAEGDDLPWRRTRDRYAVLVAEAQLQATPVARVLPYYERWMGRWPTAGALAAAPLGEVLAAWQGLGYPRRRAQPARRGAAHRRRGLAAGRAAGGPPGRGGLHRGGDPVLRRRRAGAARRHQRAPGAGPPVPGRVAGHAARRRLGRRPGPDGPRAAGVHRARAAVRRRLPAARGMPRGRRRRGRPSAPPAAGAQGRYEGSMRQRRGVLLRALAERGRADAAADPEAAESLVADGLARRRGARLLPAR